MTGSGAAGARTAHDAEVARLVAECLGSIDDGEVAPPFERICADRPDLLAEVRLGVDVALSLPALQALPFATNPRKQALIADRYRLGERLGAGAMGVVYAALDLDLQRPVAVKVMQDALIQRSATLARFEREAEALAAVQHPAVVTIYDRGVTDDGTPFLVMELVEGIPCADILERAAERGIQDDSTSWLTEEFGIQDLGERSYVRQALRWVADVANGLEAVHAVGIVHRDVKPSNILIRFDGRAVLLDFGIAAVDGLEPLTKTGQGVGTPAYMAPEAFANKDPRPSQDVYGLAATLYHLLTLHAPYRGTSQEVLAAIAIREPQRASQLRPGLPRDAQAILDHGLSRSPGSRYATLGAMESDLRALLAYQPVSVRPISVVRRIARRAQRSRALPGAAVTATLLLVAFGVVRGRDQARRAAQQRFRSAWPTLPANFGIVLRENRAPADAAAAAAVGATLDALVASGSEPVVAYNLRAAYHADRGQSAAAASDLRALARAAGTEFSRALVERTLALAPEALGPELTGLPDPASADDVYLLAFQRLRTSQYEGALELLSDERLASHRHAFELRLVLRTIPLRALDQRGAFQERDMLAGEVVEQARERMSRDGFEGATLLHLMGTARLFQGRFGECLSYCDRALAAAPASHVALQNAAEAAYHTSQLERARRYAHAALELVPGYLPVLGILARVEAEDAQFERARAIVAEATFPANAQGEQAREELLLKIAWREWFRARFEQPDVEDAARLRDEIEAGIARLPEGSRARRRQQEFFAGVISGDDRDLFRTVLRNAAEEAESLPELRLVLQRFPANLTDEETSLLRRLLERLYADLASETQQGGN